MYAQTRAAPQAFTRVFALAEGRTHTGGALSRRVRSGLVQVALAPVLLVGAGLLRRYRAQWSFQGGAAPEEIRLELPRVEGLPVPHPCSVEKDRTS